MQLGQALESRHPILGRRRLRGLWLRLVEGVGDAELAEHRDGAGVAELAAEKQRLLSS